MYHCDHCGWDGDTPALQDLVGEGCGGVVWTLRVCPDCGEEVYETVILNRPPQYAVRTMGVGVAINPE